MEMTEDAQEILEKLWIYYVGLEGSDEFIERDVLDATALRELEDLKIVDYENGKVHLTLEGIEESRRIIKSLKLSEKLKEIHWDSLEVNREFKFFEDSNFQYFMRNMGNCTCNSFNHSGSHFNKKKPSCGCGEVCKCAEKINNIIEASLPLSQVKEGEYCKLVYFKSTEYKNLRKILSKGILPGVKVKLIQKYPKTLFMMENTQISLGSDVLESIYVEVGHE